jgi:hypothetical protein
MNNKLLLPIIRRAMPKLIAEDIIGVQSMGNPFSKEEYPFQLNILDLNNVLFENLKSIQGWCSDTFKDDEWVSKAQWFAFKTESAYAWFLLKWS